MTAYMALLAANQPWNLILFMVIPVACAETLVASEFFVLYGKATHGDAAEKLTKYLGFFLAIYYACLVVYLLVAVVPGIEWQGPIDILAIAFFFLAFIPAVLIALSGRHLSVKQIKHHFIWLISYLIIAHLAMVFGMLDPALTGDAHPMHDHAAMEMNSGAPMQMDPSSGRMDMGPSNAAPMQQEPNTQGSDAAASQPASDGMTSVSASSPAAAMPMGSSPADMQGHDHMHMQH
jgi:hypothetical protein